MDNRLLLFQHKFVRQIKLSATRSGETQPFLSREEYVLLLQESGTSAGSDPSSLCASLHLSGDELAYHTTHARIMFADGESQLERASALKSSSLSDLIEKSKEGIAWDYCAITPDTSQDYKIIMTDHITCIDIPAAEWEMAGADKPS